MSFFKRLFFWFLSSTLWNVPNWFLFFFVFLGEVVCLVLVFYCLRIEIQKTPSVVEEGSFYSILGKQSGLKKGKIGKQEVFWVSQDRVKVEFILFKKGQQIEFKQDWKSEFSHQIASVIWNGKYLGKLLSQGEWILLGKEGKNELEWEFEVKANILDCFMEYRRKQGIFSPYLNPLAFYRYYTEQKAHLAYFVDLNLVAARRQNGDLSLKQGYLR